MMGEMIRCEWVSETRRRIEVFMLRGGCGGDTWDIYGGGEAVCGLTWCECSDLFIDISTLPNLLGVLKHLYWCIHFYSTLDSSLVHLLSTYLKVDCKDSHVTAQNCTQLPLNTCRLYCLRSYIIPNLMLDAVQSNSANNSLWSDQDGHFLLG